MHRLLEEAAAWRMVAEHVEDGSYSMSFLFLCNAIKEFAKDECIRSAMLFRHEIAVSSIAGEQGVASVPRSWYDTVDDHLLAANCRILAALWYALECEEEASLLQSQS